MHAPIEVDTHHHHNYKLVIAATLIEFNGLQPCQLKSLKVLNEL